MSEFDICVLGGGPGGYAAALYAASAGLKVAIVEKDTFGGTCLNRGCIPAKGLLQAAEVYRNVQHADGFGFRLPKGETTVDWPAVNKRKSGVVNQLVKGLEGLIKKRKIEMVRGFGTMNADGKIVVDDRVIDAEHVIIVSGSVPKWFPGMEPGPRVITSDQATNSTWETLPKSIAVIGGGVIGVEFASVFVDLGVDTTLLEYLPNPVLPIGADQEVAAHVAKSLKKRGLKAIGGAKVGRLTDNGSSVTVPYEVKGKEQTLEVEQVLVAVGRRPLSEDQGFAEAGVQLDDRGFIEVDTATMRTTRDKVYAVGDVVNTPGLAHVAYAEAIVAVRHILGEDPVPVDYGKVPWIVYAHPEIAWSGMTEEQAKEAGIDYEVRKHPWPGNGRSMIVGETEGMIKILARPNDGPIIGFHLCGPWASELMNGGYYAVNWEATPSEVAHLIHAHPSLSEIIGETMITFSGRSLHG
ncbi:dihydrolipoyl dehydrogenase [Naumannella sp. ID2617S]|uniref:Dihydrolipoyl dehydrogenase n=1 Tax=Enemella dayhoffiae TaxID=2016507 RepID=A0A255GQD3_9ACTN|nr:dihydrolipoyl dehydrogenase [Enemella dayhoffiae]NNG18227.1 dihydrolipoyl dehydrogenase [Naumannella sp. ID2617S]OYO18037.1 dihydrolipoyl dehydrogenase [Enemella dayhoffiae]